MVSMQTVRYFSVTAPISVAGSVTTNSIDTVVNGIKYDYLTIVVSTGLLAVDMTALKLQSSDTDGSYQDLTGFVGAASGGDFVLPVAADDNKFVVFNVDLRGKKRFFDVVANTGATAGLIGITAILSRGKVAPNSATDQNALVVVTG
jgi:hypothetical protein